MKKGTKPKKIDTAMPKGWSLDSSPGEYQFGIEDAGRGEGKKCAYIKSLVAKPQKALADLMQTCSVEKYLGQRLRMSAWVKTALSKGGGCQLWLRIDGPTWPYWCKSRGVFDNMWDRRIIGHTDWQQYSIVVDVPDTSYGMAFGIYHIGKGTVWVDDISFESVGKDVPLTGCAEGPINLSFEETEETS
jgi:hypothetical protein